MDYGDNGYKFYTSWEEFDEEFGLPDQIFNYKTNPLNPDTDFSGLSDSVDPIPKDYDMNGNNRINHPDLVDPDSDYYVERIARAVRHDEHLERQNGELIPSIDMSGDDVPNDEAEDMTRDGMPTEYEKDNGVADGGWQHPYLHNARYALLIAGGASDKGDIFPGFWTSTKEAYFKLVEGYQYQEENVYMMSSRWKVETEDSSYVWKGHNSTTDNIVDGECMWENNQEFDIKDAIRMIGKRITKTDFVYVQIYSHGWTSAFRGRDPDDPNKGKVIRHATFQEEINRVWGGVTSSDKKYARAIMVIDTCSSEQAAESFASGKDRIGISSTEDEKYSYTKIGSDRELHQI